MLFFIEPIFDDFSWVIQGYYATLNHRLPHLNYLPWWNHRFIPDDKMADLFEDHELVLCSY